MSRQSQQYPPPPHYAQHPPPVQYVQPPPQRGGGVIDTILALAVMGGIGYGVWYALEEQKKKKDAATAQPSVAAATSAPTVAATTPAAPVVVATPLVDESGGMAWYTWLIIVLVILFILAWVALNVLPGAPEYFGGLLEDVGNTMDGVGLKRAGEFMKDQAVRVRGSKEWTKRLPARAQARIDKLRVDFDNGKFSLREFSTKVGDVRDKFSQGATAFKEYRNVR